MLGVPLERKGSKIGCINTSTGVIHATMTDYAVQYDFQIYWLEACEYTQGSMTYLIDC
jgi:hypothetical protein